jgi:hypothetical protein
MSLPRDQYRVFFHVPFLPTHFDACGEIAK